MVDVIIVDSLHIITYFVVAGAYVYIMQTFCLMMLPPKQIGNPLKKSQTILNYTLMIYILLLNLY